MSLGPNEKRAFSYLRNGFVRYEEDGVPTLGGDQVDHWRLLAKVLSKRLERYVPDTYAWALFCEAIRSGWIKTKNGVWCGRLNDRRVAQAIKAYMADQGPRYVSRYFKGVPREEPACLNLTDSEMAIWQQGYREGLRRNKRRVA